MDVINPESDITQYEEDIDWVSTLADICNENDIKPSLVERLLIVEKDFSNLSRRIGIFNRLEKVIEEEVIQAISNENGAKK